MAFINLAQTIPTCISLTQIYVYFFNSTPSNLASMTWRKTTAVFFGANCFNLNLFFSAKMVRFGTIQVVTTYEFMKHSPCSKSTNTIITTQLSDLQAMYQACQRQ